MAYVAPTVRTTGELISASIWNVDIVANIAYFKNAPTFDGAVIVTGTLAWGGGSAISSSSNVPLLNAVNTFTAAGSHTWTASGNGAQRLVVTNTTSDTLARGGFKADAGTTTMILDSFAQGFTTSGSSIQSGSKLEGQGAGGLVVQASNAAGTIRFYLVATERGRMHASGGFSWGDTTDPGANNFRAAGTAAVIGDFSINTNKFNVTAASGNTLVAGTLGVTGTATFAGITATSATISTNNSFQTDGFVVASASYGAGAVTGPRVQVGYNASGGGAAGILILTGKGGALNYLWVDASAAPGMLRISTAAPEEDGAPSDTSGTVVGNQTSTRASKDISGSFTANATALRTILKTPLFRFRYKGGAYNNQRFVGITTDDSPEFGMDLGRSFNPVNAFGYTVAAIKELMRKLVKAERQIATLRARHA